MGHRSLEQMEVLPQSPLLLDAECQSPTMVRSLLCTSRRHVRFEDQVTFIPETDDVSDNEDTSSDSSSTWYSQSDYNRFRSDNLLHLQQSRLKGTFTESSHWSPRGFEYISMRYPRKSLRLEHMDRVLQFQDVLKDECPTALADYASNSSSCNGSGARARALAKKDQQEAAVLHPQSPLLKYTPPAVEETNEMEPVAVTPPTPSKALTPERTHHVPQWSRPMLQFFRCI